MPDAQAPSPFAGVILAGGRGTRAGLDTAKQYARWGGSTVLGLAVARMREAVTGPVIIVIPAGDEDAARAAVGNHPQIDFVIGGATRQLSALAGLERLASHLPAQVLIHDAARPDLPRAVVGRLADALIRHSGAVPVLPVADSLLTVNGDIAGAGVEREGLRRVQTPQAFRFSEILHAHRIWPTEPTAGDDATVLQAAGFDVALVAGDPRLRKLTFRTDFARNQMIDKPPLRTAFRIGSGYDVHRLVPGDGVWLCGIRIPHHRSLSGHSDADVALHALTDAVLGAIAAGDIGEHFPPSDPQWKGASSDHFFTHAMQLARIAGYAIANLDVTIICEEPKIGAHRQNMRNRLAELSGGDLRTISVKATTTERLGFTGRAEGIAAQASVLLHRIDDKEIR
ncbi:bifunctional 2-C-methyl-D-erythritol 4-phosphate cytidylyltransferase/2-C-methyl-D-erythritol 2,4-cyclodiphosphate synthase [Croceicoccus sp. F390]|uniref:Bifunctional enzyme IspD/IspF n=1 Tax=Croceicoccus esteveae TaxID=3075597 RepID=A0ABU2ZJS3_9SPHN|nr:bifunctional 2-C-methyl-D-erythritol 4-phosphate cytidylyltransferase/2-C-methyl-D-erythritol 2,4-cyclodiphosphate synthase [Croceicoccus sp. F390]MDT0576631.1 bifunctional 2-C-methyl-D-erythritol 4-phosphate cytidylyltransferase/2-C-methyl-D-erythritol 2,4-cyclodiphosphate synthase [Croceicoccus sp. F390]